MLLGVLTDRFGDVALSPPRNKPKISENFRSVNPLIVVSTNPARQRDWKCRQVYHISQSGSQRAQLFDAPVDFVRYLDRLDVYARRAKVRLHAFGLTAMETQLLLEPLRRDAISAMMQQLQSDHSRYMNQARGVSGHLYCAHFHADLMANSAQYRATLLTMERESLYSSAPAHAANEAQFTVAGTKVKLYLNRWRRDFDFEDAGPIAWDTWLHGKPYAKAAGA